MIALFKRLMKFEGREGKIIGISAVLFWLMLVSYILNGVFG